ncbi:unnamed protein product [Rotaria magnacalcarata]
MSRIHFLVDGTMSNALEDVNSRRIFSPDYLSRPRHGWRYLIQRILNNKFDDEFKIEELERIYKIPAHPYLQLPSQTAMKSIITYVGSIVLYPNIHAHMYHTLIYPAIAQLGIEMILSEIIEFLSDSPSIKQNSFFENNSLILSSPQWRRSIDEQHLSSPNSHIPRLSQRSVSYGFGPGIKTWRSIHDEKNRISSSSYYLPPNKIELDKNQQEMIRRTLSFKRKSDIIS